MIRDWISVKIARHLTLKEKTNWNAAVLPDIKTCSFDQGGIGREKKKEANEKRRKFYKNEKGIVTRRMYNERMELKKSFFDNCWQWMWVEIVKSSYLV